MEHYTSTSLIPSSHFTSFHHHVTLSPATIRNQFNNNFNTSWCRWCWLKLNRIPHRHYDLEWRMIRASSIIIISIYVSNITWLQKRDYDDGDKKILLLMVILFLSFSWMVKGRKTSGSRKRKRDKSHFSHNRIRWSRVEDVIIITCR